MNYHVNLIDSVTADGTGTTFERDGNIWNYQAVITGTGSVSATVTIQVSNNGTNWETFGTMSLTGTGSDTDSVTGNAPWRAHRAVVSSLTGTGATVSVYAEGV